jgi:hypothetical protein
MAILDAEEAAANPFGRLVARRIDEGDGLWAWAVTVDDIAPVADRLGSPVHRVERDGFGASVTGVVEALSDPYLPFFVARDSGSRDPSRDSEAGGISWIELGGGGEARLRGWLGGAELPVRFVDGPVGVRAIGIGAGRAFS